MGWIRVEDNFYDNEKMLAAGSIGRDLYWHGMGFCNRNLTDGIIPKRRALTLVDFSDAAVIVAQGGYDGQDCAPIAIQRLLDADLWHEDGHDCPDCVQPGPRNYVVHDYLKYQPSREQVEAKREAKSDARASAGRRGGQRSAEVRRSKNEANGEAKTKQNGSKTEAPTPNPTPNTSLVDLGGELTQVSANEPPPCPKHGENNSETPCAACRRRRVWAEQQEETAKLHELDQRRQLREARENCPRCHGTNTYEISDGVVAKCDHRAAVNG